jgi:hypothetical protein
MVNLRKFQAMTDLVHEAADCAELPYSYWYRLFPEDPQFPARPWVEGDMLAGLEGIREVVETAIEECWGGTLVDGSWERSLRVKKIIASAGF